jgi:hypothetical protein
MVPKGATKTMQIKHPINKLIIQDLVEQLGNIRYVITYLLRYDITTDALIEYGFNKDMVMEIANVISKQ